MVAKELIAYLRMVPKNTRVYFDGEQSKLYWSLIDEVQIVHDDSERTPFVVLKTDNNNASSFTK